MGAEWDRDLPSQRIFDECLRVLKPGGHIFVMSSERLDCIAGFYHLLANAGFEVDNHQLIGWLTLSGMPKSSDVAKTADNEAFRAWLAMHRETVTCPQHDAKAERCPECERIFVAGGLTRHDQRKAESAAVNGECPPSRFGQGEVLSGDRTPAGAGMYDTDHAKQRHSEGTALLTRLLASHWPASPAEQRAHWEACVAEVPEGWDCSRPPGVRVKTGSVSSHTGVYRNAEGDRIYGGGNGIPQANEEGANHITAPSTPDAVRFDGWRGSVAPMKPMLAPILHACKPWRGSYLDCARERGGGVLNVEAGRIPYLDESDRAGWHDTEGPINAVGTSLEGSVSGYFNKGAGTRANAGRVPGNLLSYGDLLADLQRYADISAWCEKLGLPASAAELLEAGLVYAPKPSRREKQAGLSSNEGCSTYNRKCANCGKWERAQGIDPERYTCRCGTDEWIEPRGNTHATVKPVSLCAYLAALCTREGETVLDPFCGSGSTGVAAALLGRRFVGVELSEDFAAIARARIAHAASAADDTPAEVSPQPALMEVSA